MTTEKQLIELNTLIDNLDWDNDIQKWVLRGEPEDIPTVDTVKVEYGQDAVVGQAYWVADEDDVLFHCSECGTQVSTSWDYEDLEWNYCPNCGKHMTAEPDVEDDWDSYMADRCYECEGYGDDYYTDENGELVSACDDCPYNGYSEDDWDDD